MQELEMQLYEGLEELSMDSGPRVFGISLIVSGNPLIAGQAKKLKGKKPVAMKRPIFYSSIEGKNIVLTADLNSFIGKNDRIYAEARGKTAHVAAGNNDFRAKLPFKAEEKPVCISVNNGIAEILFRIRE